MSYTWSFLGNILLYLLSSHFMCYKLVSDTHLQGMSLAYRCYSYMQAVLYWGSIIQPTQKILLNTFFVLFIIMIIFPFFKATAVSIEILNVFWSIKSD